MKNKKLLYWCSFLLLVFFQACKKDKTARINPDEQPPAGGSRTELTLDSIFLYAKQVYLWNTQLPTYKEFNPRHFSSFEDELFAISQEAINPQTGRPYEYTGDDYPKYSYLTGNGSSNGIFASTALDNERLDFGFAIGFMGEYGFRIRYVEPGSPADEAGLTRGYQLTKINDIAINSNTPQAFFEDAMMQANMSLTVIPPGGSAKNISLSQEPYNTNPVLKKVVLTAGGKKVAYLAYLRFSDSTNSAGYLNQAFDEFAAAGNISDLIVDLRYNGGGYVKTAQYLSNLIASSALNGKTMYIEHYNDLMRSDKADILVNQILKGDDGKAIEYNGRMATYADLDFSEKRNTYKFDKKGPVQTIKNVYFIIGRATASASELLINNLKPYLNVKLIGDRSYGKPVGFFPIDIDNTTVYMSNFQTRNSNNEGDYFAGFSPNIAAIDDMTRDFGNPAEMCLSAALADISGGSAVANTSIVSKNRVMSVSSNLNVKSLETGGEFKGMVEDRWKLKK